MAHVLSLDRELTIFGVDNTMTFAEKFGTFEEYQKYTATKALEYQKKELEELRKAATFSNDYAVRQNIGHDEVLYRLSRAEKAVEKLTKLLEADGEIKDPIYLAYWRNLKDKEC